ncbi:uncharacterized protein LOC107470072 [Arachis duranensis]|uniref:Uncharacterized protein LOC107470072 n=1 Tax=Arachis duranensis TaxID=130453 RepID=A0A6P4C652_ARADU|nr:uncharacterized protein LOC107470072 [Arachis duranensis]
MSSMMSAQGVVFATAMAVSGTVILLALRLQKSLPPTQFSFHEIPTSQTPKTLRSCISSAGKKSVKKKKKRVHFAEDVMDSCGDGEEFRRRIRSNYESESESESKVETCGNGERRRRRGMPENRVALYNGILRDRVAQRLAYSC